MTRRNLTVLVVSLAAGALCFSRAEQNPYARDASRAYRLIDSLSLEDPPDEELFAGAVQGMVAVLRARGDEHSAYLPPQMAQSFEAEMSQRFGGVGVRIGLEGDPPRVVVVEPPLPGTPAYAAGIRQGDTVVAVDGRPTAGRSLEEVVSMTRGRPGEPVTLTVRHESGGARRPAEESFLIVREVIRLPSVLGDRRTPEGDWRFRLEQAPGVALVRLITFGEQTPGELRAAIDRVLAEGAEAVVLDLRQNPGGPVGAAIEVARLFLPEGAPIVSTRGRDGEVLDTAAAAADGPFLGVPLAVLIDSASASASEIVAAALQDNGRAAVVGARSFGKGTVQTVLPLGPRDASLKLTSATYWRPSGVNIHRLADTPEGDPWGVSPDEGAAVELTDAQRDAWLAWRRERDLAAPSLDAPPDAPPPLEADRALAAAVERLSSD
ncbi:S41 family peptidase [Botrimarina sp.]|uniref:S41 family peptidase n=1 Tax=Botrimarina sp. TaxID=2795802 RepID=UPI0032EFF238